MAAEYALQIKQGLKSCLDTAIIWILGKFILCSSNETSNITVQCVYVILMHPIPPRLCRLRLPRLCRCWRWLVLGGVLLLGMVSDGIIERGEGPYLLGAIRRRVLRPRKLASGHVRVLQRGRRGISKRHWRWNGAVLALRLLLSGVFLMCLDGGSPGLDKSIFNRSGHFREEHRACIYGPRHRFLPRLQHFLHLPANVVIHECICFHEGREQLSTEEQRVWCADILDNRVEEVKRWEFLRRTGLN